jgi:hypothetical protein
LAGIFPKNFKRLTQHVADGVVLMFSGDASQSEAKAGAW